MSLSSLFVLLNPTTGVYRYARGVIDDVRYRSDRLGNGQTFYRRV